jgi:hypothetical protein
LLSAPVVLETADLVILDDKDLRVRQIVEGVKPLPCLVDRSLEPSDAMEFVGGPWRFILLSDSLVGILGSVQTGFESVDLS